MTLAVRHPVVDTPGLQLGNRIWRKQIMKKGALHYQGQDLDINDAYLRSIVDDFRSGASMDTVPFFYANDKNEHNQNPDLRRGNVVDLELTDDGLYGVFRLSDAAHDLVTDDDKFGVSVEVRHGHVDGNGVHHPVQLRHVLGTYDAVWNGLKPWEAVEEIAASNTGDTVIDFTTLALASEGETPKEQPEEVAKEGPVMPELKDTLGEDQLAKLRGVFSDEQIAVLGEVFTPPAGDPPAEQETEGGQPRGGSASPSGDAEFELSEEDQAAIERIAAELIGDDTQPGGYDDEPAPAGADEDNLVTVSASNEQLDAIQLANDSSTARIEQLELQLANQRAKSDAVEFEQERDRLARTLGVPPRVTDILRPMLEGSERTVRLANTDKAADAGALVRRALDELAKVGFLDLSNPTTTAHDADTQQSEKDELERLSDEALDDFYANRPGNR